MKQVRSSTIESVSHHNGTLTIKFKSGGIYDYHDCPADLHAKLMAADSHGKFFHEHIKSKYTGKRREE